MNRILEACLLGFFALNGAACAVTGVGDPCIPEDEFDPKYGQSVLEDLSIDVNSVQCETRVCLRHYFRGRVSCPFGNGGATGQGGTCQGVSGKRNLYTLDGSPGGTLCCPILGDTSEAPIQKAVDAQCKDRQAADAVYCSCRCDVPADPDIDKNNVTLCKCPSGFSCVPLCDKEHGNCGNPLVPKGKYGSYCVKDGPKGAGFDPNRADQSCTSPLTPP